MSRDPIIRLQAFLPYRLSIASNSVSKRIARAYEERFQLSIPEWRVIAILGEEGRATPLRIAERAEMDKISVSRSAKRLEARGALAVISHPADGRSHFLELTAAGRDLYERIAPLALRLEDELLASFSEAERSTLVALLEKLRQATQKR